MSRQLSNAKVESKQQPILVSTKSTQKAVVSSLFQSPPQKFDYKFGSKSASKQTSTPDNEGKKNYFKEAREQRTEKSSQEPIQIISNEMTRQLKTSTYLNINESLVDGFDELKSQVSERLKDLKSMSVVEQVCRKQLMERHLSVIEAMELLDLSADPEFLKYAMDQLFQRDIIRPPNEIKVLIVSDQKLKEKTEIEDETIKLMSEYGVAVGELIFPKKTEPGTSAMKKTGVKANLFSVAMEKKLPIFQFDVLVGKLVFTPRDNEEIDEDRAIDLLMTLGSKFLADLRISMARKCFKLAIQYAEESPINLARLYYDGSKTVYSLDPLPTQEVHLRAYNASNPDEFFSVHSNVSMVYFVLKQNEKKILLGEIPQIDRATADMTSQFRPLQQFIEVATTEHALLAGRYIVTRGGNCYSTEDDGLLAASSKKLPPGTYFSSGARKNVRIIEGEAAGTAKASLAIKPIVTPFHTIQTIAEKVLSNHPDFATYQNGSMENVKLMLIGLHIRPIHRPHVSHTMVIVDVASTIPSEEIITHENQPQETIYDYFLRRYDIEIEHPKLPLVVVKDKGELIHLPMSLCEVAEDQPLRGEYAKSLVSEVLAVNCVVPRVFEEKTLKSVQDFKFNESPCLQQAGLTIEEKFSEVDARVLQTPEVIFRETATVKFNRLKSNWLPGTFYFGSQVRTWAIWVAERPLGGLDKRVFDQTKLEQFAGRFVTEARRRGIEIGSPNDLRILDIPVNGSTDFEKLKAHFVEARQAGCQFIVLLSDIMDKQVHGVLKKLEQSNGVVTQNVTVKTAGKFLVQGGNLETVNNILQKTNEKCGGANYLLGDVVDKSLLGKTDLFVGIAVNHLTGVAREGTDNDSPSVIGYTANDQEHALKFTGDYIYAKPFRNEIASVVSPILEKVLQRFNANRGEYPTRVFLYLNNLTEGTYVDLLKYVIPLARAAIKKKCAATLTVINCSKLHNVRLIPSNIPIHATKTQDQNVEPGTVVDTKIVSPLYNEFYLNSHSSPLGTAHSPRFSVVCNDGRVSSDDIQRMTFYLALAIQIINKPISLPAPIHIALENAKRGRMNLATYTITSSTGSDQAVLLSEYERLTSHLSYEDNPLRNSRFNA